MSWLTEVIKAAISAVASWSRKRPPEPDDGFNRAHMLRLDGSCIYCEQRAPQPGSRCPGPPKGGMR